MTFIFRWLIIDYSTKIRPFFDLPKGFENIFTFFYPHPEVGILIGGPRGLRLPRPARLV
jgi:hypothetical protein